MQIFNPKKYARPILQVPPLPSIWGSNPIMDLTAVKRKSMRNALGPARRPRKFPRQNLTETIAEPVLRE